MFPGLTNKRKHLSFILQGLKWSKGWGTDFPSLQDFIWENSEGDLINRVLSYLSNHGLKEERMIMERGKLALLLRPEENLWGTDIPEVLVEMQILF